MQSKLTSDHCNRRCNGVRCKQTCTEINTGEYRDQANSRVVNHFLLYFPSFIFFPIECQATCFKNSSYIFSKSGRGWYDNRDVCLDQGFDLVSIETEEEWKFIKHEIQKRGTWNTSAWHIGLWKIGGVWTWLSGEQLNISKWRDSEPDGNDDYAEISRNGGLFNGISRNDKNAYICEIPGGKIIL